MRHKAKQAQAGGGACTCSLRSQTLALYCLISTSYLTELFVYYSTCGVTPILGKEPGCTNVSKEKCFLDWLRSTTQINKLPRIRLGNTPIVQWISRSTGMRANADSNLVRDKAFSLISETCIESHLQFISILLSLFLGLNSFNFTDSVFFFNIYLLDSDVSCGCPTQQPVITRVTEVHACKMHFHPWITKTYV